MRFQVKVLVEGASTGHLTEEMNGVHTTLGPAFLEGFVIVEVPNRGSAVRRMVSYFLDEIVYLGWWFSPIAVEVVDSGIL